LSDGQKKKKYIEMFGSFTEPFNCIVQMQLGVDQDSVVVSVAVRKWPTLEIRKYWVFTHHVVFFVIVVCKVKSKGVLTQSNQDRGYKADSGPGQSARRW